MKTVHHILTIVCLSSFWANALAQWSNIAIETNSYDQSEPAVAYSPLNENYLLAVWNDFRLTGTNNYYSKPGFKFSTNNGSTWQGGLLQPTDTSGHTFNNGWDPSCAFGRNGNAYYCYVAQRDQNDTTTGPVYISRTSNFGVNWYHSKVSPDTVWQDKPYMTIDNTGGSYNGRIYVSWSDFNYDANRIRVSHSTDQGATWSSAYTLASLNEHANASTVIRAPNDTLPGPEPGGQFLQGSIPAVGPNGDLYVVWLYSHGSVGDTGSIHISRSTDGGSTFGSDIYVAHVTITWASYVYNIGSLFFSSMPTIAVSPTNGNLYVAYTQYSPNTGNDIYCTRSTNSGSSWSTPIIAPEQMDLDQIFPWLAVSPSGTVSLIYYEGNQQANRVKVRVAHSFDNGSSFYSPNSTLTPDWMNAYQAHWTSDYIGITASSDNSVYPVWTDFRNSLPDIYGALYNSSTPAAPQNLQMSTFLVGTSPKRWSPKLTWTANSETDMSTYKIYRTIGSQQGTYSVIGSPSHPTAEYVDYSILTGSEDMAYYKITANDVVGLESGYSNTVNIQTNQASKLAAANLPTKNKLHEAYPNPFNPSTQIKFDLPEDGYVSLNVFDVLGRKVTELANGYREAGYYGVTWNASSIASGVYFARFTVTDEFGRMKFSKINKLLLAK